MQSSRVLLYLAVLAASLAYLSAWHAADHAPGVTPSAERLMAPLDDAYIFGQYARQALKGEWLHYTPGAPISTGVSSFSWLLALTALMGLGWPVTWAAWALGALCLGWSVHSLLRLSARLFPALPDWALPVLFLAHASSVSLYFQGMDSGLLLAALLACASAALEPEAKKRFWALAALLAFTRPEGQVAVPALALVRAWPLGLQGRFRAIVLSIALAAAPTLSLWAISGSPIPDSARPKTAGMELLSPADRFKTASHFALGVGRSILLGWPGRQAQVGVAGHASAGNDPGKHFPIFSLFLAALGLGLAWRQGSQRPWWTAMAAVWALTFLLLAWTLPVGWHRHRYLAPLWPLMLIGIVSTVAHLQATAKPWQRLTRSALLTIWFGFGLLTWPWFLRATFQSAVNYARANREAAFALSVMSAQTRIVVEDAGLLAYYSGRPIIDLLGVTDHRFALVQTQGPQAVFQELLTRDLGKIPMTAVLHPQRTGSYSQLWASPAGPLTPTAALGDMVLYSFRWSPKAK